MLLRKEDDRIRHQIEHQSEQIERVFMRHQIETRVFGGQVKRPWTRFDLQTQFEAGLERFDGLKRDLQAALGAVAVRISGEEQNWHVDVKQGDGVAAVTLLSLLNDLPQTSRLSAVLGVAEDGRPLLIDLAATNAAHAFIAGGEEAGKSSLLRTIALSLALNNRQSQLQFVLIDGHAVASGQPSTSLRAVEALPHAMGPVVESVDEAIETLQFLAGEIAYRSQQRIKTPSIVVIVDEVVALLAQSESELMSSLAVIAQSGAAVDVHLILATAYPNDPLVDNLIKANLPVRLVGQVRDASEAIAAAGMSGTNAEYLVGRGDFMAFAHGVASRFQAAYVDSYDMRTAVESLYRRQRAPILAVPFDEDAPFDEEFEADDVQPFAINSFDEIILGQEPLPVIVSGKETIEMAPDIIDPSATVDQVEEHVASTSKEAISPALLEEKAAELDAFLADLPAPAPIKPPMKKAINPLLERRSRKLEKATPFDARPKVDMVKIEVLEEAQPASDTTTNHEKPALPIKVQNKNERLAPIAKQENVSMKPTLFASRNFSISEVRPRVVAGSSGSKTFKPKLKPSQKEDEAEEVTDVELVEYEDILDGLQGVDEVVSKKRDPVAPARADNGILRRNRIAELKLRQYARAQIQENIDDMAVDDSEWADQANKDKADDEPAATVSLDVALQVQNGNVDLNETESNGSKGKRIEKNDDASEQLATPNDDVVELDDDDDDIIPFE